jgi:hypothetical protein
MSSLPKWTRLALASALQVLSNIRRYVSLGIRWFCKLVIYVPIQRRFKAAFEAYKERELPNVKLEVCDVMCCPQLLLTQVFHGQRPGLRLQQYHVSCVLFYCRRLC